MSEVPSTELFQKLFDTLDLVMESMPIRTGDLTDVEHASPAPHPSSTPKRAPLTLRGPSAIDPPTPPAEPALDKSDIDAFFAQNEAYGAAVKLLHSGDYAAAYAKLEPLARDCPDASEFQSAWSYARFKLAGTDGERQEQVRRTETLIEAYPSCASSRLFLSRMLIELGRVQGAVRYLKEAWELVPEREDVFAELRRANEILNQIRESAPEAARDGAREGGEAASFRDESDKKLAAQALAVVVAAGGLFYVAFVALGLGRDEEWRPIVQGVRAAALAIFGLGGGLLFARQRKLERADFAVSALGLVAAVLVGLVAGGVLAAPITRGPLAVVAGLALARVLAEELFFRYFLGRLLAPLQGPWRAPLIVGLFFGLYQATYAGVWVGVEPGEGPIAILMITAFAGIPYAFLHHRTKSLLPPLAAHLIAGLAAAVAAMS